MFGGFSTLQIGSNVSTLPDRWLLFNVFRGNLLSILSNLLLNLEFIFLFNVSQMVTLIARERLKIIAKCFNRLYTAILLHSSYRLTESYQIV